MGLIDRLSNLEKRFPDPYVPREHEIPFPVHDPDIVRDAIKAAIVSGLISQDDGNQAIHEIDGTAFTEALSTSNLQTSDSRDYSRRSYIERRKC